MPTRQWRLSIVAALLALIAGLAALAYASKWPWLNPATTDIAGLAEAARGEPVRIEGNVTYYDAERGVAVVQDDTAAVAVGVPSPITIRMGHRIRISGILPKDYDPTARVRLTLEQAEFITLRDEASLPTRKVTLSEIYEGTEPLRFEVAGIVRSVRQQGRRTLLDVTSGGMSITAVIRGASSAELAKLIDARVSVRGVRFVQRMPENSWRLLVMDSSDVIISERAPARPALLGSLQALIAEPSWATSGHRIRVRGRVLQSLSDNALLLTDGIVSIPVESESTAGLDASVGTLVEVEGWPVNLHRAVVLQGAAITDTGVPAPLTVDRTPPLTSVEQIKRLRSNEAARAHPVRVNGVVTAVNVTLGLVFMQNERGGLNVRVPRQPLPLTLGQRLTVRGVTNSGDAGPIVVNAILEPGAAGTLPTPAIVTADDLSSGSLEARWVEMEGKVRAVQTPLPDLFVFKLRTTLGPSVDVSAAELPEGLDLATLIDAKIRIHGVLSSVVNKDGQIVGRRLSALPAGHLQVLAPPPADPFSVEARPIDELLRDSRSFSGNRTQVSGTVVLQRGDTVYIEDTTGGVQVDAKGVRVKPGDVVSAVGYPSPGVYGPTLTDAAIRKTALGAAPQPTPITAEQAMSGKFEHRLVQIEARVLSQIPGTTQQHLVLQSGAYSFDAEVLQRAHLSLAEGSIVRLTGVCTVHAVRNGIIPEPSAFRILVPNAGDIEVVRAPPLWNARNVTLLFGALACGTLLVLAWVSALRRRVRAQTHEIDQQKEFLRQVIDIAPNFIFVKDTAGRFTLANRALAAVYRTTPDEMIGKTIDQLTGTTADGICGSRQDDQDVIATLREKVRRGRTARRCAWR